MRRFKRFFIILICFAIISSVLIVKETYRSNTVTTLYPGESLVLVQKAVCQNVKWKSSDNNIVKIEKKFGKYVATADEIGCAVLQGRVLGKQLDTYISVNEPDIRMVAAFDTHSIPFALVYGDKYITKEAVWESDNEDIPFAENTISFCPKFTDEKPRIVTISGTYCDHTYTTKYRVTYSKYFYDSSDGYIWEQIE